MMMIVHRALLVEKNHCGSASSGTPILERKLLIGPLLGMNSSMATQPTATIEVRFGKKQTVLNALASGIFRFRASASSRANRMVSGTEANE